MENVHFYYKYLSIETRLSINDRENDRNIGKSCPKNGFPFVDKYIFVKNIIWYTVIPLYTHFDFILPINLQNTKIKLRFLKSLWQTLKIIIKSFRKSKILIYTL